MMQSGKVMAFLTAILLVACDVSVQEDPVQEATGVSSDLAVAEPAYEAIACPAQDFDGFLAAFASDDHVRYEFTAQEVLVTDWRNPDETQYGTEIKAVSRADYRNFTLRYQGGAFHDVAPDGTVDPKPLEVRIMKEGEDYLVKYIYGLSEGNSWRFERQNGCWLLVADPEASDP